MTTDDLSRKSKFELHEIRSTLVAKKNAIERELALINSEHLRRLDRPILKYLLQVISDTYGLEAGEALMAEAIKRRDEETGQEK